MRNLSRHIGQFEILTRLPNSQYGNPRYLCRVAGFTCRTEPDSSFAYGITDFHGKKVNIVLGTHYGKTTIDSIRLDAE